MGCVQFLFLVAFSIAINLAKWLVDLLAEWELTYLLDVITTDTAANCLGIYKVIANAEKAKRTVIDLIKAELPSDVAEPAEVYRSASTSSEVSEPEDRTTSTGNIMANITKRIRLEKQEQQEKVVYEC
jgi:hypothetical protein